MSLQCSVGAYDDCPLLCWNVILIFYGICGGAGIGFFRISSTGVRILSPKGCNDVVWLFYPLFVSDISGDYNGCSLDEDVGLPIFKAIECY